MMKLSLKILSAFAGLLLVMSQVQAGMIKTDFVFVVDESSSMAEEHAALQTNFSLFADILLAGGLDAEFGLIAYSGFPRMLTDLTDVSGLTNAASNFTGTGADEPIFDALAFALDDMFASITYRNDSLKNIIVIGDEANNGNVLVSALHSLISDAEYIANLLDVNNALLNVVMPSAEVGELANLATNTGGNVFDINGLLGTTSEVEAFISDLANAKVQESIDFCLQNPSDAICSGFEPIPEPSSVWLFVGAMLLGLRPRR